MINYLRRVFRLSDSVKHDAEADTRVMFGLAPDKALTLSAVFACVRRISETIGALPCQIYRRDKGGGKEQAPGHRLYYLLHQAPNADMTALMFQERIAADLCLYGNHFSEIYRNGAGQVTALYPLEPRLVDKIREYNGREFIYKYADPRGAFREIPETNMLFVAGFNYDLETGLGLSPVEASRRTLENAFAADEVASGLFRNGVAPSGILSTDRTLNPEQRQNLRDMLMKQAGALRRAGGLMVMENGLKYEALTFKPVDAQILESRLYGVEEICTIFGVPPHMIGHTTKSTSWGSGLEQQNLWFVTYTIQPYLKRIETALTNKLLGPIESGRYLVEYNLDGLLRADSAGRSAYYSTALQNGWMSRNEVRRKENLNTIDGGDEYTVQVNLTPLESLGKLAGRDNGASN